MSVKAASVIAVFNDIIITIMIHVKFHNTFIIISDFSLLLNNYGYFHVEAQRLSRPNTNLGALTYKLR